MASCLRIPLRLRITFLALLLVMSAALTLAAAAADTLDSVPETNLDQEIHVTRERLAQVAAELRDAKLLAAEKLMEYEVARDQYQLDNNPVNANSMDHSQQRLALAEMGVEARTAKFDRIQKKLEALAQLRQETMEQPAEPEAQNPPAIAEVRSTDVIAKSGSIEPEAPTPLKVASSSRLAAAENVETPPLARPVFDVQGKVTDALELTMQLQKLERHLMTTASVTADPAIKVKAYGTAIPGELILSPLGGNQYFARFAAPAGQVSLIVGARMQDYYRRTLELEFLPQEQGEEFVLIFDLNQPEDPRALVFPESMMFEQEKFAAHNDY